MNATVRYRFLDFYANTWRTCRCYVMSHTDKTAIIKLVEFGPRGKTPGTIMRVSLKSLVGFETNRTEPDLSWHDYTDI